MAAELRFHCVRLSRQCFVGSIANGDGRFLIELYLPVADGSIIDEAVKIR